MSAVINDLPSGRVGKGGNEALQQVRCYWNAHIHDWKVAQSEVGSKTFFEEIEECRFEKLSYLPRVVNFDGYRGQRVLDVGCGVGNDLACFARGGAEVVGIDICRDLDRTRSAQLPAARPRRRVRDHGWRAAAVPG